MISAGIVVAAGVHPGCSCNDATMMTGDDLAVGGDGGGGSTNEDIDPANLLDFAAVPVFDGGVVISDDGGTFTCVQTKCNGKLLACGDCLDNDGDGRIDFRDPECLGPCDNTEGPVLAGGVGGQTGVTCKNDCYFDFGNGSGGRDECTWDHRCDPLAVAPDYPPAGPMCQYDPQRVGGRDCPSPQTQTCQNFCRPLTPNGCDCFGCCTFPQIPGQYVFLGSRDSSGNFTCTFADVTNPAKCHPCTPQGSCFNDCGRCELCIGKSTLPPDCIAPPDGGTSDMQPPPRCDTGVQPCGLPGDPDCPSGTYCITGCCIDSPIF